MNMRHCVECQHEEAALERARTSGLRITKGLRAILNLLHTSPHQMSPADIHSELARQGLSSGLPTVYRICTHLANLGVLARLFESDGSVRYYMCLHGNDTHHHHFVCRACHRVTMLEGCPVSTWSEDLQKRLGIVLESHVLELQGLCAECYQSSLKISP